MEEQTGRSEQTSHIPPPLNPLERLGHPFSVIFMGICICLGLQMLIPPFFSALFDGIFGTSLISNSVHSRLSTETEQVLMKLVIILTQTFSFGGTALLFARMANDNFQMLPFKPITNPILTALSILIAFTALPVIPLLMIPKEWVVLPESMKVLEDFLLKQESQTADYLSILLKNHLALNLIFIAVTPAITEELFFRGFMMGSFRKFTNIHVAIWATGFLFSLLHLQILGFFPRMALGVIFGYLCFWSGSLLPCILAHFINNAVSAFAYYAQKGKENDNSILNPDYQPPFWIGLVAMVILGGLMYLFYYYSQKESIFNSVEQPNE